MRRTGKNPRPPAWWTTVKAPAITASEAMTVARVATTSTGIVAQPGTTA